MKLQVAIDDILATTGAEHCLHYDAFAPEGLPFLCIAVATVGAGNVYIQSQIPRGNARRRARLLSSMRVWTN